MNILNERKNTWTEVESDGIVSKLQVNEQNKLGKKDFMAL